MTPERWREVERLYHAALEQKPEDRRAFLRRTCGTDDALRAEVESLLDYEARAERFIEDPAAELSAPVAGAVRRVSQSAAPGRFAGRLFGVYELQAAVGSGGMGEVYRAVDTRLGREVAIKILPEHVAGDSAVRERFKREATIISSLNHPNICALYDVGSQDGIEFLVMEYLEGETLETRLHRGPLPLPQALEVVMQIVDALDKVHRRGVVHRDLKPANIMITKSGVKLLDFGVAAAVTAPAGAPSLTAEGMIVGTVPYMSPEQVQGRPPDVRTDIFALGAVAYEMITGRKAFTTASQAELISAILRDDPPAMESLVPDVPIPVSRTIEKCLAKDPNDRWQSASDLLFHLRSSASSPATKVAAPRRRIGGRTLERAAWIAVISVIAIWTWTQRAGSPQRGPAAAPVRFAVWPAAGVMLAGTDVPLAVSPDGRKLVYVGTSGRGVQQLWLRSLDSDQQRALSGTEGANTPFWSPDSEWVGFFAGRSLKRVRISSGLIHVIADGVSTFGGAAWSPEDVILFPAVRDGLTRVSARGGPPSRVPLESGVQFFPHFLSDGKRFLYVASASGALRLGSLGGEPPRTLMNFPVRNSTVAWAGGYVFFVQDSILFARRFDEQRLAFAGDPVRLADGIPVTNPARAPFSVSPAGVLAYWPNALGMPAVLRWFERDGSASSPLTAPAQYYGFALSPDARRLLLARFDKSGTDLWLRDLGGSSEVQLTFEGGASDPQWSPDGSRIAYSGYGQTPPPKLFVRNLDSPAAASLVAESILPNFPSSWSADGRSIVSVRGGDPAHRHDLWLQWLDGAAQRLPFNTPFNESNGKVSPDGKWIAYTTDQSGRDEVWVANFPAGENPRQVSSGGGRFPLWGEGSRELVYVTEDKTVMSYRLEAGTTTELFAIPDLIDIDTFLRPATYPYVVAAGGRRFLAAVNEPDPSAPPIQIIVNWPALVDLRNGAAPPPHS